MTTPYTIHLNRLNRLTLPCLAALITPLTSLAHEGHGSTGAHWHATDVWGFVAVVGLLAAAAFWGGRK